MKIALVTGFLACQVICSFSLKSRDCVSVKEACVSESRACRSGWELLKNVCHISDGSCLVVESDECNMTIAYLLGQFPDWRGCLCTEENYCSTPELLAPNCHSQTGGEASKQSPSWFEPDVSSASISPEGQGCLSILLGCQESPSCWSAYRKLRNSCSSDRNQCRTLASRSSCLLLWGELMSTPLANCTCPVGGKRCLKLQALLQDNPCICAEQESSAQPLPKALQLNMGKVEEKKDSKPDWQRSGLLKEARDAARDAARSCLRAMTACVSDEVCNGQLVPLVRACSEPVCEAAACGRATERFYRELPPAVADVLAFCACDAAEPDCLRVRDDLQSGTCLGRPASPPICLEVYDRCMLEPLCRQRYRTFQSRCLGEGEETLCHTRDCLRPPDPGLIRGGDAECRRAFVGMMGTAIQQPCTCDGAQNPHLLLCQRVRQVFRDRTVFIYHLNEEVSSHHTTLENVSHLNGQRFSDQLFFALICVLVIVLILMVVITVLSTSRLCRGSEKAKRHPPTDRKNSAVFQ